jgi:UDP-N-acetylglucosamine:LPS N-acetylglucosamine transferase
VGIIRPKVLNVMFISRGHGRGHAVPDMAIAASLKELCPDLRLQFVSYAAGAEAYRACGYEVTDLQQPDKPPLLDMIISLTRLLANEKPDIIVAHEEYSALTAAKAFGIPSVFITDYFVDPSSISMWALRYTDEIIFTAERGLYTEPPFLKDKIHYVGRAVRPFKYARTDQTRARQELGISQDALVVLCQPGAWVESVVPFAELLSTAWNLVPNSPKRLIWIGGRDYQSLALRCRDDNTITVLKEDWQMDRLMAASDILITKANRMTVYEAAAMGVPSISISGLANWPDDVAVANVQTNTALFRDSVSPERLAQQILAKASIAFQPAAESSRGVSGAAERILHHIEKIRSPRAGDDTQKHSCAAD